MPDKAKPDDPAQSKRFINMAREIESNEDQAVFEKVFGKVVQPMPPSTKRAEKK